MKTKLGYAFAGILLTACSNHQVPQPPVQEFDSISLQRSACYGHCPVYKVEIIANGQVRYSGEEYVSVKGVRQSIIPQQDIEIISAALRHVKFVQLKGQYSFREDGCVDMPTDMASFEISVKKAGNTKAVIVYEGCSGPTVPAEDLQWLSDTIDAMARTRSLIYK